VVDLLKTTVGVEIDNQRSAEHSLFASEATSDLAVLSESDKLLEVFYFRYLIFIHGCEGGH
jgi:hypothetical protein